jgi:FKBP-type peptidyl-prolyl cis-trans isomerase FkpA
MSVSTIAHQGSGRKSSFGLWFGLLAVIAAGIGLAWFGTESVRKRVVQVETVQAGTGPTINPEDGVMMEYEGRVVGGKTFDSSAGRGPATFIAGQTIPGFTQALSKMQRGGRYKARIPGRLAYGATPPPGSDIPPNADLEFDIQIVNIIPNAAAMMGAMQQPQQ